jgi:hypothetical protein
MLIDICKKLIKIRILFYPNKITRRPVFQIRGIFARIRILGSVPKNYGSGSGSELSSVKGK